MFGKHDILYFLKLNNIVLHFLQIHAMHTEIKCEWIGPHSSLIDSIMSVCAELLNLLPKH